MWRVSRGRRDKLASGTIFLTDIFEGSFEICLRTTYPGDKSEAFMAGLLSPLMGSGSWAFIAPKFLVVDAGRLSGALTQPTACEP